MVLGRWDLVCLQGASEDEEGNFVPPEGVSEEPYERLCIMESIVGEWLEEHPYLAPQPAPPPSGHSAGDGPDAQAYNR